jgi:hypothetical protein
MNKISSIKNEIGVYLDIRRNYLNPADYLKFRAGRKTALLTNRSTGGSLEFEKGKIRFSYKRRNVEFEYNTGELRFTPLPLTEIFFSEAYSPLRVRGMTVVDIGSSIGDTPVYFLLNGARKVYCYETDKFRASIARSNIEKNGLSDKVEFFGEYDGRQADVAKIDCESCEYGLLRHFGKFKEIILEYHRGFGSIEKELRAQGFAMTIKPSAEGIGIIYARKLAGMVET